MTECQLKKNRCARVEHRLQLISQLLLFLIPLCPHLSTESVSLIQPLQHHGQNQPDQDQGQDCKSAQGWNWVQDQLQETWSALMQMFSNGRSWLIGLDDH